MLGHAMALKSTRYRKVEPAALNRRSVARQRVKVSRASFRRSSNRDIKADLVDISVYGCRLEADAVFQEGEEISLDVASADPVTAVVVWHKVKQAGCRFKEALDPEILRRLTLAG
ncbi:PilZ domain-containing protein [Parasphingorhabdus marina DSM 22363]|uniref:PilZ domain-containing protein n=2 Tax=Parasphingorhabdus marina TaxID=394732 RepID=A0A1N6F0C5_9SPHN|nr:PilZ domain-containing protein [Parasphingorhabdus marina DSM 22363]